MDMHHWAEPVCVNERASFILDLFFPPPSSVYAAAELNEIEHNLRKCPADAEV